MLEKWSHWTEPMKQKSTILRLTMINLHAPLPVCRAYYKRISQETDHKFSTTSRCVRTTTKCPLTVKPMMVLMNSSLRPILRTKPYSKYLAKSKLAGPHIARFLRKKIIASSLLNSAEMGLFHGSSGSCLLVSLHVYRSLYSKRKLIQTRNPFS